MYCPKCGSEYREGFNQCSDCKIQLVNEYPIELEVDRKIYAGFWKRFLAFIIDYIIILVVWFPITWHFVNSNWYSIINIIQLCSIWLYFALFESSFKQATLGKIALGIVVTDIHGNKISFGKATGRTFSKMVSSLLLGAGFIAAAFTKRKQGLHDIISETLVINKSKSIKQ